MKNTIPTKRNHRQSGWTLIELVVCGAVLAVLAAGVMTTVGGEREKGKGQKLRSLHVAMLDNITAYFEPNFVYTGINNATVVDGKLAPISMRRGTGATATITTPYGSSTTAVVAADDDRTDLFRIDYDAMPSEYCALDIKAMSERSLRVEISAAGGDSWTTIKDMTAASPVLFQQATLATQCATNSPTYKVRFTQG
ncbi:MAG: type II secretion system protein [Colwellia sp.]